MTAQSYYNTCLKIQQFLFPYWYVLFLLLLIVGNVVVVVVD